MGQISKICPSGISGKWIILFEGFRNCYWLDNKANWIIKLIKWEWNIVGF